MVLSTKAIRNVYLNNIIYAIVVLLFFAFSVIFKINEISKEISFSLEKSDSLITFFIQNTAKDIQNSKLNDINTSFLFQKMPYLRAVYNLDKQGNVLNIDKSINEAEYVTNFSGYILQNLNQESLFHISKPKIYKNKDESIFFIIKNMDGYLAGEFDLEKLYEYFNENKILNKNTILLNSSGNAVFKEDIKTMDHRSIYEYLGSLTKINSFGINLNTKKDLIVYKITKNPKYQFILLYNFNLFNALSPSLFVIILMISFFILMLLTIKLTIKSLEINLLLPIKNLKNIIKNIKNFNIKKEDIISYKSKDEEFNEVLDDISYIYKKYKDIRHFLKDAYYKDNYIFNQSSLIILMINAYDGSIVDASKGAVKFYKYTKEALLNKTIFDIDITPENNFELENLRYPYKKIHIFKAKHILCDMSIKDVLVETSYTKIQNKMYQIVIARDITYETNLIKGIKQEHQILDISPFTVFYFSDRVLKKVDFVSYTVSRILGYGQEEIMNENFDIYTILHPDDVGKLISIFKANMRLTHINSVNTQFEQPCRVLHKNGTYTWFNLFFRIIKNKKQSIQTIIYAINYADILKQKNSFEYQIQKYKNLILSCNIITFEINLKTNMISFSENLSTKFDLNTKDKVISMNINSFKKLVNEDDFKKLDYSISEHANNKKEFFKEEIRVIGKDGKEIWVLLRGKIITRDQNKEPLIIYGGLMDIDFQKKLTNLSILHKEVFLNSSQSMIITDEKSNIIETNKAFDNFFGYQNIIGQNLKILKSAKNDIKKYKKVLDYIRHTDYYKDILWIKAADNSSILSMFSVTKIKDEVGNIKNYVISFHTISENAK
ncbi:MAG: PAS domain S-box protein [Campylobacter sputorum]|uniref:PAS domain S-box protein n=1 Tax=Campylobacter sputorum TaxID=206 RepID=UPI002A92031D|nr:PAS domain S-box protein [Campylobacter sputorum]MDY6119960.1 PAS domain S-box protein [Campylobacter sputorum]